MTLAGAKTQNFFGTAILFCSVVFCWSAEAAPKNSGHKQIARNAITAQIGKESDRATCYVYNNSYEDICVTYDVYPVWYFSQPARGTVSHFIEARTGRTIAWVINAVQTCFSKVHVLERFVS